MRKSNERDVTAYNIAAWYRWAASADSEIVQGMRAERVEHYIFPGDLNDEERERREKLVEQVRKLEDAEVNQIAAAPVPPTIEPPKVPKPLALVDDVPEWRGLIPPTSPAYKRATLRDGTGAQVAKMGELARSTPFFDDAEIAAEKRRRQDADEQARQRHYDFELSIAAEKLRNRKRQTGR